MADDRQVSYEEERRRREAEEPLDFSPSSTAVDPEHAAQDTSEHVQTGRHAYTENATFTEEPMEAQSDKWLTLNQANRNIFENDDTNEVSEQNKQDYISDTTAWGHQIGLTDYEVQRAVRLVEDAEDGWKNNHGVEAVILAALTLAANEGTERRDDVRKALRPESPFSEGTPEMSHVYENIRTNLDVEKKSVRSCRKHLRDSL